MKDKNMAVFLHSQQGIQQSPAIRDVSCCERLRNCFPQDLPPFKGVAPDPPVMIQGSRIIFDYPRLRWAIIRDPIPGEEKAPYDYEFVTEWEKLFGHNEELAQPVGYELNDNPVNL